MLTVKGRTGTVIDTVDLVDGALTYTTAAARSLIEGPRQAKPSLTDGELYDLADGASNGYFTITSGT